jgi:hypothetical protein
LLLALIRGGHIFLTMRIGDHPVYMHGDRLDLLLALNQISHPSALVGFARRVGVVISAMLRGSS